MGLLKFNLESTENIKANDVEPVEQGSQNDKDIQEENKFVKPNVSKSCHKTNNSKKTTTVRDIPCDLLEIVRRELCLPQEVSNAKVISTFIYLKSCYADLDVSDDILKIAKNCTVKRKKDDDKLDIIEKNTEKILQILKARGGHL